MAEQIAIVDEPRVAPTALHVCHGALSSRSPVRMRPLTDAFQGYMSENDRDS
jgi:hypothetical protein